MCSKVRNQAGARNPSFPQRSLVMSKVWRPSRLWRDGALEFLNVS
jgi:hypothetical protein